ncbi:MAG: hypothetical protein ABI224_03055 [Acetobacteraceae bacterium]
MVLTFLSGMSARAALCAPAHQMPGITTMAFAGHGAAPSAPICPLSKPAGCATAACCIAAVADTAEAGVADAPHLRHADWYAADSDSVAGRSVMPSLFPPIRFA